MSIKKASVLAPKSDKGASKKNKKSWRKNTSIEDIEDFLDDQRLEERLGGAFDQRKDEDLFMVDAKSQNEAEEKTPTRLARRKARLEKPLKCYQHLEITSGVSDPVKKRNRRRTLEERKNPLVVKKEELLKKQGIVKAKELISRKDRNAEKLRKAATLLERTTRRRTEFDFDLWSAAGDEKVSKVKSNEWLDSETKSHTLKNTGKVQRKVPHDFNEKTSLLPAVEVPHAGASYNPSLKDHQDLLWRAAVVELNKEKEQHRIDYHTTRMFPDKKDAPDHNTWLAEMSEGVDVLGRRGAPAPAESEAEKKDGEDGEAGEESDGSESDGAEGEFKLKTKKQRRKEKARKNLERKKLAAKKEELKHSEIFRLKSIKRELKEQDQVTAERIQRRSQAKTEKMLKPAMLSGYKFEEPELEIKLSNELTGNLRSIKPEGNLIEDRYKSLQKRNVIETRVKQKIVRNKKKRKRLEKRNYKMGFSWEK